MKLLAIDVGNSRAAFGIFEDGQLERYERHKLTQTKSELIDTVQIWGEFSSGPQNPHILSSCVRIPHP